MRRGHFESNVVSLLATLRQFKETLPHIPESMPLSFDRRMDVWKATFAVPATVVVGMLDGVFAILGPHCPWSAARAMLASAVISWRMATGRGLRARRRSLWKSFGTWNAEGQKSNNHTPSKWLG